MFKGLVFGRSLCWFHCLRQEVPAARTGSGPGQLLGLAHTSHHRKCGSSAFVPTSGNPVPSCFLPPFLPLPPPFYLISCLNLFFFSFWFNLATSGEEPVQMEAQSQQTKSDCLDHGTLRWQWTHCFIYCSLTTMRQDDFLWRDEGSTQEH